MDAKLLKGVEIYGFSGKLGTGKNYISEKIFMKMMEPVPTAIISFADQIKVNGIVQHGLDRHKCFAEKDEHTRKVMQRVGTEEGRDKFGEDIWLKYAFEWMAVHASRGIKRIIVSDVRFHNEFDFIKSLGGIMIRVDANGRNRDALQKEVAKGVGKLEDIANHKSETELDSGRQFDYRIDNDHGAENVHIQVRQLIRSIREKSKQEVVIFCDLDNTICECNEYYKRQLEKTRGLIRRNLKPDRLSDTEYDRLFDDSVRRHNGKYSHMFFHINRFAFSMMSVFNDFIPFMPDTLDFTTLKEEVRKYGMEVFDFSYKEIDGRVAELKVLSKLGRIVIFTMGDRLEQVKKISELQLMDYDFEVYDFKDATIFRHLCDKYPAKMHCMIGDSLQRDVLPAIEANLKVVIRILDKKESYWGDIDETDKKYHEVSELHEAAAIIEDELHEMRSAPVRMISSRFRT